MKSARKKNTAKKTIEPLRLQKWLSQLGITSRRQAESWMKEGRLRVNGSAATELGLKVTPGKDKIELDGDLLPDTKPEPCYWLLSKPDGIITTRKDPEGRSTIFDLPSVKKIRQMVFSVGRLDFHTEGLLILSNDGELVHRLMHPKYKLPRHYYILTEHQMSPVQVFSVRSGIKLDDGITLPASIKLVDKISGANQTWYQMTVFEGRNRLIRRIFETLGHPVMRLIRFGFGDLRLPDDLAPGECRPLSRGETLHLKGHTDLLDHQKENTL